MLPLQGHKVLLGISGGIAAYKSATLARRLIDVGADVRVVMTHGAQAFITPLTLQALTGNPVHTDLLDTEAEAAMGHIELARWADHILIAPASANLLARLAHGFADDLLSTLVLATDAPVAVAPAMNRLMWANPATQANIATLKDRGIETFGPAEGAQACGETGAGRLLEPEDLRDALVVLVKRGLSPRPAPAASTDDVGLTTSPKNAASARGTGAESSLAGLSIVVTAGPTHEAIDPVRFLGNRSSGRMGYAIAENAAARGARVTLISGPVALDTPAGVTRVDVVSARDMYAATHTEIDHATVDIFIAVAAVADFRVDEAATQKIKKTHEASNNGTNAAASDGLTLELVRNPDILASIAALPNAPFCVGFAAETESLAAHARDKLKRKQLDMIAANHVAQPGNAVFGSDTNALEVFWPGDGHARIDSAKKTLVADQLLDLIATRHAEPRHDEAVQAIDSDHPPAESRETARETARATAANDAGRP